jgi:hypothetical protein
MDGLDQWGAWSSRGTYWLQGAGSSPEDELNLITWIELDVTSDDDDHARVIRPEIKASDASGVGHSVWWVAGCIAYRHEVDEG